LQLYAAELFPISILLGKLVKGMFFSTEKESIINEEGGVDLMVF
jgi:hypothetical protein